MPLLDWLRWLGRGAFVLAAAAVPDFALVGLYLGLWVAPRLLGLDRLNHSLLVLALEFFAVHAAGVLGLMLTAERQSFGRGRASVLGIYLAGITAVLVFVCVKRGEWWPLLGFWGLTGNRLAGWWKAPNAEARRAGVLSWVLSPVFYAAGALLTTFAPVPALGMTPSVVAEAGPSDKDLWSVEPQRGLAFGVLYFGLQATLRRRLRKASEHKGR